MFEGYSVRARQVIFLSRIRAGQRGADSIVLDDMLAALIIEDQGKLPKVASEALPLFRSDSAVFPLRMHQPFFAPDLASDVLKKIEELLPHSQPLPTEADMPMSTDLKHTLGAASDIFEALQNKQIEPLHLLAAAVAEELSIGARTLRQAGITQERVLKAIRGEEQS